ncbi:MAG: hypothetical protein WA733_00700 [Methylocystis sp.]
MGGSLKGERRGGRQRGTKNKRTLDLARAQAETSEKFTAALGPAAFTGDAHALLMSIYRDASQPVELRVTAARAAIPFEKTRLSATELSGRAGGPIEVVSKKQRDASVAAWRLADD